MATRASSRRSAGGADVLNRATIHLLGLQRLKEELTKLGLPLDGSKEALADRLEDWINGVYVPPPVTLVTASSTPSTSRNNSAKNTPGTRPNSAKGPSAKRTPRRKTSVGSAGDEETPPKPVEAPPKKKPRRNSTKKEQPSPDCSTKEGEPIEEIFEESFSVTIVESANQFDPEDDEPLIKLKSKGVAAAAAAAATATTSPAAAPSVENGRSEEKEERKKKRRRKEDDDIESGAVLAKGDSEWVPPEETEKRSTRESAKKRTRKNTSDAKEDAEEPEEASASSMPVLDPEIYDQEGEERPRKTAEPVKASSDRQRKPSTGEAGKKVKPESGSAVERTRSIGASSSGAVVSKEKRRESTGAALPPRPPREKPATLQFAELMAQRKAAAAAAAAAAASNGGAPGGTTPAATLASTVVKKESSQEKEKDASGGGASPLVTADKSKSEQSARRESIGGAAAGSPAADAAAGSPAAAAAAAAPRGFQMNPRKNAPPRPSAGGGIVPAALPDLLGDLLGKQQVLLKKNVKSTAEAEAEKIRIVSQIKQRAPDLKDREETVIKEKERLAREEEEKRRAKEERERRAKEERERKALIIAAPTRPIPPPPPFPPVKLENSPHEVASVQQPAADAAVSAPQGSRNEIEPKIELLEEEEVEMKYQTPTAALAAATIAGDIEPPEYEPLLPGPSMPPLDRSIADAHHKARAEKKKDKKEKRRDSKDHGLIAPEVPFSANDPFLLSLSDKLKKIARQREYSPILPEVRECMDELLAKVESKVEKEQKWERKTKRKSEYQVEREKEQEKKRAQMMADPLALLAKASTIFESMHNNGSMDEDTVDSPASGTAVHISQDLAEPGTYEEDTEDKPLPEFHGEPVPSDDDEALFLEAAGLPKKDKRPKHPVVEEEAPPSHEHILMDYYNACLHVKSATDKPWLIEPDNEHGLALMWGGVRTNHGYVLPWREEKKALVFQIKITEYQGVRHIPFNEQDPHDVRIGFSLRASPNIMGEAPLSWAFSTTGKKCVNNAFQEWGQPCELGDVVTAVLDFSSSCVSFYRNDECMGVAFSGVVLPDGDAVYAHVCVKNCKVAVNLGEFPTVDGGWRTVLPEEKRVWDEEERKRREEVAEKKRQVEEAFVAAATAAAALGLPPPPPPAKAPPAPLPIPPLARRDDWAYPTELDRKRYEMSRLPPNEKASCTLLMMVGLPGVGKSTWVRQYIRDHPEEKWDVINAEAVMAAMKVNGVARGRAHTGRWDMVLGLVAKALQKMVLLAARRRRNYIVDLSNVNKDSRKRKLMHFKDFTKKCVVLVPDEEEMVRRQMQQTRQDGASHVPAAAILEMKAVFSYPGEESEGIDVVHLIEPPMTRIADAIEIIHRFNVEGKPWYPDRYRGRGSRRGRGGYMGGGGGDRRGSDYNRPLSVSTAASNGSGPPTGGAGGGGPSPRGWGMAESPSTAAGHFSWGARKSSN